MNAVVLAGGVRSGLEVPGSGVPRALWPFPSEPLISGVLHFLREQGCERIAICANGKTKMIASDLAGRKKLWLGLHYSEDPLPRGPAGCLRDLQEWLGGETFVVVQGAAHYDFDLRTMLQEHRMSGAAITVGARMCSDDTQLREPAGVYLVEPKTLALVQSVGFQDMKEQLLPKVIAAGMTVHGHTLVGTSALIHSPAHYLAAIGDAIVRAGAGEVLPEGFVRRAPGVIVHRTANIHPSVRLTGPVWIDAGVTVEEHALLAGPVIVAEGSRVCGHALVHNAVVMKESVIAVAAEVMNSVVGPKVIRRGERLSASTRIPGKSRTGIRRLLSMFGGRRPKSLAA
jgi:mannose-1-phosphate guanylyltransferase